MTPNPFEADRDLLGELQDSLIERRLARVFAGATRDDAADAAMGATAHVDALTVQRARMHATAVAEADPDRPRRTHLDLDDEDRF